MSQAITASVTLLATLLWAATLLTGQVDLAPGSVLLVGIGLISIATTSLIGVVVIGARWAWRSGLAVIGLCAVLAVTSPIDPMWIAALSVTCVALAVWLSPALTRSLRRSSPISGPPIRALIIPLLLLCVPYALGLAAWDQPNWATMTVGLSAPLAALWYARVLPLGLLVVRVVWPVAAIAMAPAQTTAAAVTSALAGIVIAALAWHHSVKVAFHPPREVGSSFPIAPELAPREVLDTARLDEKGRPRS